MQFEGTLDEPLTVKLNLSVPKHMPSLYVHNMIVQDDGYDLILTFLETIPPLIPPDETERKEALDRIEKNGVDALPVAKLRVSKARIKSFADLLDKWRDKIDEELRVAGETDGIND